MQVSTVRLATKSFALAALAALVVLVGVERAHAAPMTATWTGGGADSNWTTALNWDIGVPLDGDTLVFPAAANRKTNVNTFPNGTSFEEIRVEGGNYTISGNVVVVVGEIRNNPGPVAETTLALSIGGDATFYQQSGSLFLVASNSYTGDTVVTGGEIVVQHTGALGQFDSTVDIYGGAVSILEPGNYFQRLHIGGATAVFSVVNSAKWLGPAQLFGPAEFNVQQGITFELSSVLSGGGAPLKTGGGILDLSGQNTFGGVFDVVQGTLRVSHNRGLGSGADGTIVRDGAVLELDGPVAIDDEFIQLYGAIHNLAQINHLAHLTVAEDAEIYISGGLLRLPGGLNENGAGHLVEKHGPGTLEIEGNGSFAGTLLVNEGYLSVRGTVLAQTVIDGGELVGDGFVGAVVGIDGYVVPGVFGAGTGVLRVTGPLTLGPGMGVDFTLNSAAERTALRVSGPIELNSPTVYVDGSGAVAQGASVALIENDSGLPIQGEFLLRPEGSVLGVDGNFFRLTYAGGPIPANDFVMSPIEADLDIAVAIAGPPTAAPSSMYVYTVDVRNLGASQVGPTLLRVVIPQGAAYVSAAGAVCSFIQHDAQGDTYHCSLANIPAAPPSRTVTITAAITIGAGAQVTFTASVEAVPGDPSANNSAQKTVLVAEGGLGFKIGMPGIARDGSW